MLGGCGHLRPTWLLPFVAAAEVSRDQLSDNYREYLSMNKYLLIVSLRLSGYIICMPEHVAYVITYVYDNVTPCVDAESA
jgi:hypothetical protein